MYAGGAAAISAHLKNLRKSREPPPYDRPLKERLKGFDLFLGDSVDLAFDQVENDSQIKHGSLLDSENEKVGLSETRRKFLTGSLHAETIVSSLERRTCCCLGVSNPIRQFCLRIYFDNMWFDRIILFVILLNVGFLSATDPTDNSPNPILETAELIFNIIFTIEILIKVIAVGMVGEFGFFSDAWNKIDFVIVLAGWLPFIIQAAGGGGLGNLTAIRTVRTLKALKTIDKVEGLKKMVVSLLKSVPLLVSVLSLMVFLFFIFGILGNQLFSGVMRQKCFNSETLLFVERPFYDLCSKSENKGGEMFFCPTEENEICSRRDLLTNQLNSNPGGGYMSFDNIGVASVTILTMISLEGWVDVMYPLFDALGFSFSFVCCSFFS